MLELLVVIGIIGILAAALLVAGSKLIDGARSSSTAFMLGIVRDAVELFKEEQQAQPGFARPAAYQARYGFYPPDELEVFSSVGIPPAGTLPGTRAPNAYEVWPKPASPIPFTAMTFQIDGLDENTRRQEHRDLAAVVLAINLYSDSAWELLSKLDDRNWIVPEDDAGLPLQFLDRNGNEMFDASDDLEIRHIVDAWGIPITYMSQRNYVATAASATKSENDPAWNEASTAMVRLNAGQPIISSFGPNGADQLSAEMILAGTPAATLVADFADDGLINSALNEDNVYPDATIKEKLAKGRR